MRNLLLIATLFLSLGATAQVPKLVPFGGISTIDTAYAARHMRVDSVLRLVKYATGSNMCLGVDAGGIVVLKPCGGFDTTAIYIELGKKLDTDDTAAMLANYTRVQRFLDSVLAVRSTTIAINGIAQDLSADRTWTIPVVDTTSLSNRIDGKLSTTDTGAMLSPYATQNALNLKIDSVKTSVDSVFVKYNSTWYFAGIIAAQGAGVSWGAIGGTLSDQTDLANALNDKLNVSDTATMLGTYLRKADTASMSTRINARVAYVDTATMLNPYLRKGDTASLSTRINAKMGYSDTVSLSNRINAKLNISDTSTMLGSYLRKVDTASLSNRINLKLNIADTSGMLSPYLRKVDTTGKWLPASTYIPDTTSLSNRIDGKLSTTDTATMLSPYLRKVDTVTLSTRINLKVNISDTANMLNPYLRKSDTAGMLSGYVRQSALDDTSAWVRDSINALRADIGSGGGGGLDTTAGDVRYLKLGGNAIGTTVVAGSADNQDMSIVRNGAEKIKITADSTVWPGIRKIEISPTTGLVRHFTTTSGGYFVGHSINRADNGAQLMGAFWFNNGPNNVTRYTIGTAFDATGISVFPTNRVSIGKVTNTSDQFEVSGASTFDGTSSSTGYMARFRNSSGTVVAQFNNNNTAVFSSLSGTGTRMVVADDNGVLSTQTFDSIRDSMMALKFNEQTGTTYTLQASDKGKIILMDNTDPITVTIPVGLPEGFQCLVEQEGAGQITFTNDGTSVINSFDSAFTTKGTSAVVTIYKKDGSDTFTLSGNLE